MRLVWGLVLLVGCAQPVPSPNPDEIAFREGLDQYHDAIQFGFDLTKPGAGHGAISHVSLFERYAHVYYLPLPADALIREKKLQFLLGKAASKDPEVAAFGGACLDILLSPNKLRRDGVHHWTSPVRVDLVCYHYD